jgi:hypothetical protein
MKASPGELDGKSCERQEDGTKRRALIVVWEARS